MRARPDAETDSCSLEVFRAISCEALARLGAAANAAATAARTNDARRSGRAADESGRAP
jgi:hypothetical protein